MNFEEWYENADMPQRDSNGNWYDLECGTYFEQYTKKKTKIKKIKSEKRKKLESELRSKKKLIKDKMKVYDPKNWSAYSHEEKRVFYALKEQFEELEKIKITFPMIKLEGKTYSIKDFIKERGGKWYAEEKCWYVPSDFIDEVKLKMGF